MNTFRIILAISWMNLKTIRNRLGASIVIIVGIGGVVAVLVSLLAMAKGFEETLKETGRPDRALVLRAGSNSEINGNVPLDQSPIISFLPGVNQIDGQPNTAMETFVTVKLPKKANGELSSIPMRGVGKGSYRVRQEFSIVRGRKLAAGKLELLAGVGATARLEGLEVGSLVNIRGTDWLIVGHFTTNGSAYESEIWVDERLLAELYNRGSTFSSMLVQLESSSDFDRFKTAVENDKRLTTRVVRESDYYSAQSQATTELITGVGLIIGTIMSIGAVFAALNTMYSAISTRTVEIATLKALGFEALPIFFTVLMEALILALIGGAFGGLCTFAMLNGYSVSTVGGTYTQVSFAFMVTGELLILGIGIALCLGLIGGLPPAFSAVRMSIVDGLKGTT